MCGQSSYIMSIDLTANNLPGKSRSLNPYRKWRPRLDSQMVPRLWRIHDLDEMRDVRIRLCRNRLVVEIGRRTLSCGGIFGWRRCYPAQGGSHNHEQGQYLNDLHGGRRIDAFNSCLDLVVSSHVVVVVRVKKVRYRLTNLVDRTLAQHSLVTPQCSNRLLWPAERQTKPMTRFLDIDFPLTLFFVCRCRLPFNIPFRLPYGRQHEGRSRHIHSNSLLTRPSPLYNRTP